MDNWGTDENNVKSTKPGFCKNYVIVNIFVIQMFD